jgi:NAD(P)-dependent dehydrogenase (short-subunit alcohol dehydrogenase family)
MGELEGKVAVVTGASRGAGRGIALALGSAGAKVVVTGRSTRAGDATEGLPGTVEDVADEVTRRGGRGIPARCDHTDDAQVAAVFARVRAELGRLDLLVNNAWGGYEHYDRVEFGLPFWEQPAARRWAGMYEAGVRAHLVAAQHAARLMIPARRGLLVSTFAWDEGKYLVNLFYDVAKSAIARMAWGMARELRPHGVASVALACGFMRTERVLASGADLSRTESPEYAGRAIAALAADPRILEKSGEVLYTGALARAYGFVDVDGTQPEVFRI